MRLCAIGVAVALVAASAAATERVPVAVLWMSGDPAGALVDRVNAALAASSTARPLDSAADRKALVAGGPATRATRALSRAQDELGRQKWAAAAQDFEAAEAILLDEAPFEVERQQLAAVERGLLVCNDRLGRVDAAERAAQRLGWTAGSNDDLASLIARYAPRSLYAPSLAPLSVTSAPAGAQVYRDLAPAGKTPASLAGGDPRVDVVDVVKAGYRRAHHELGAGSELHVSLAPEDRVGVLVDQVRAYAPDAPPAEVAALGRRVGAVRVLALMPDGPGRLLGRWLDVAHASWGAAAIDVNPTAPGAVDKLAAYAAPIPPAMAATRLTPSPAKAQKHGPWHHWYTWAAAGAVVALVAGFLIAEHVGDDQLDVSVSH